MLGRRGTLTIPSIQLQGAEIQQSLQARDVVIYNREVLVLYGTTDLEEHMDIVRTKAGTLIQLESRFDSQL